MHGPVKRTGEKMFVALCLTALLFPLAALAILVGDVAIDAWPRLSTSFFGSFPSSDATAAGIYPALVGSLVLIGLTSVMALPVGVGAAIYLEEYGTRGRLANFIEVNIANLAGVPSIIYGLLGLELFVRAIGLGSSLAAGACTMALLILPIIIMSSREALRSVPNGLREGAYALGASRWQTIRQVVLPAALPGILTGSILSVSRAIGETAPLIVIGAVAYMSFVPTSLGSEFTVLPIQIFNWISNSPDRDFRANAAAAIVVLLVVLVALNLAAILLRNKYQSKTL